MFLSALLHGVVVTKLFHVEYGRTVVMQDVEITGIQYDSKKVEKDNLFVAMRGAKVDGHSYIQDAIHSGAKAIVLERDEALSDSLFAHAGVAKIVVHNTRRTLAQLSANFYGHPADKLVLIGVTGTNGKTTTASLIKHIIEHRSTPSEIRIGLIGTIDYVIGTKRIAASHTTPESLELHGLLAQMVTAGCTYAVMEVSSHALHQDRVYGLNFTAAVFTNLTQDHLDYHGTMEEYFRSKKILFDQLLPGSTAIVNGDDPWSERILSTTSARQVIYGTEKDASIMASAISLTMTGTTFTVALPKEQISISSQLVGRFNVYNALAAIAVGYSLGLTSAEIRQGIESFQTVSGRFERIPSSKGWTVIIDYAHTPDALEKCLKTVRDVMSASSPGRMITVFGAGGDRDKTKRPMMGRVAETLSDIIIITSDNPRTEDPLQIIEDIRKGTTRTSDFQIEPDRRLAIIAALKTARKDDVVVIAGKGHEQYQVIGTTRLPFSDQDTVREFLQAQ